MDSESENVGLNKVDFTSDWDELANRIQFALSIPGFMELFKDKGKFFTTNKQFIHVISGKLGAAASLADLMAKHKAGEATLSDWLGATSDIALLVAGYTGNPALAGAATALGVASFLTSEGGQKMAKSLWDAIQKYGIADPDTGGWLLPPHDFLMEQLFGSSGPDMSNAENQASPIIIDLDGDGIETLSVSSGVFFDHDGNQFAENTGWVAPDDGLLIFDRDGNGQIDSGSELFGNNTLLKSGKLAANGYQALQELDENKDGQLNSDDAIWASLRIWQDGNSNGRVDEGELLSLEEAGVAAIGTGYSTSQYVDEQGNAHRQTSTITRSDGAVGQSADVWFAANKGYSRYTGDVTLSAEIQALPYIRGFGNMADLHTAMSLNPQLIALVQLFVADPMAAKASGLIEKLLFTWAGVADIAENSRGSYIDARQLAVLETAAGRGYRNTVNGTVNPLSSAAALLQDEYRRFAAYTEACLLATTVYASDFDFIHLQLSPDLSGLTLNFEAFEAHLNTLMQTDMGRYLQVSNVLYAWMEYQPSFADVRVRLGIPEALTFTGSDNADVVTGKNTNDVLWGGKGNDQLKGGYGDDTYLFNAGDGQDTIIESSGADTLRMGEGLLAEQAVLSRQRGQGYDSLVLGFRDRADSVIIQGYFSLDSYQVEQIAFADGTVWDVAAVKAMLLAGTEAAQSLQAYREGSEIHAGGGNDMLTGDNGNDALYGEAGDDTLDGSFGNDLLSGGTGNDTLKGGSGNDIYLFNAGDGQDTIIESSGTDTLRLGEGLLSEQAVLSRQRVQGYDSLVLNFRDRADSVIIQGYFSLDSYQVEQIVFADGTVWDVAAVKAMLLAGTAAAQSLQAYREGSEIHAGGGNDMLTGDNGNDALYGEAGDDTLDGSFGNDLLSGGTGNDTLKGGSGNDIYLFNAGDGQDTIIESSGTDTLRLGEGLLSEQAVLSRQRVQGYDSLVLNFRDRADSVIIRGYFSLDYYQVEQIVFADDTLWLPEDVLNYIEHNIPLPVMDTAESTADIALLKQEICQFLASGDVDDADDAGVAIPLATAQTTAENWRTAVGY
ncbi:hypothetical protein CRN15_19350 [Raoultella planticola]|nr:hypothetical protein CRT62_15500 [Raoultella planticola]ATM16863.1 hypothetical protein CRN15_19350 [Raoultella planticola]PHH23191.1 hypothetical protein CRX55_03595 [Raoultella planticola]